MRNYLLVIFLIQLFMLQSQNPPDTLWTRSFDLNDIEYATSVQQTSDNGFIFAGYTIRLLQNIHEVWVVKTNEIGEEEWNYLYGGDSYDEAFSIIECSSGGFIIAGITSSYGAGLSDMWLLKVDESGNEEWDNTFGGSSPDHAYSVKETYDHGYIIAGATKSFSAVEFDVLLVKTDEEGNQQWLQTYGGLENDFAYSVDTTIDGGYVIAGYTSSYGSGNQDFWVIKVDEMGILEWEQTFGGVEPDKAYSIEQTIDGGYIVAGCTESFGSINEDFWLIKLDEDGEEVWNHTYHHLNDIAYSVEQTNDDGYIIAGESNNSYWIVKTDYNGSEMWNQEFEADIACARSVHQTIDNGYIIAGYAALSTYNSDAWLIRLESEVNTNQNEIANPLIHIYNYPNPFNPSTTFYFSILKQADMKISIYNVKGEIVQTIFHNNANPGNYSVTWNGDDNKFNPLDSGVYFYRLDIDGKIRYVNKCLLLK